MTPTSDPDNCAHMFNPADCPICTEDEAKSRAKHPTARRENIQDAGLFTTSHVTDHAYTSSALVTAAKYDGYCDYCGEEIFVGDGLIYDPETAQWIHATHE